MMKIKLKEFISGAATALLIGILPTVPAFAEELDSAENVLQDGNFIYEMVDGGYAIKTCTASILNDFPGIINGYSIVEIKDGAFANCTSLSEVKIPETVKKIGSNTFVGCTSLKKVTFPSAITKVPDNAFVDCQMLEEVVLSKNLNEIGSMAFTNCKSLSVIDIPDSVTRIGDSAFDGCYSLTQFTLPDSLTEIGEMAFSYAPIETFDTQGCNEFKTVDGILYNKDETKIYRAAPSMSGDISIKDGVREINGGAFSLCSGITSLIIPDSVETIGSYGFSECTGIKSVKFSEGLKSLGQGAFAYNLSLEFIELPVSLEEIGGGAFMVCTSMNKVILQENLKFIGENAFLECPELKQITIPKSVETIGNNAFGMHYDEDRNIAVNTDFKMSVSAGSAAAEYAKKNKIDFKSTGIDLKKLAFIVICVGIFLTAIVFAVVLMARSRKSPTRSAKKAHKEALEKEAEENYKKITD